MRRQLLLDRSDAFVSVFDPIVNAPIAPGALDVSDYPALRVAFRVSPLVTTLTLRWQTEQAPTLFDLDQTFELGIDQDLHFVAPVRAPWLSVLASQASPGGGFDCRIWGLDGPVDRVRSVTGGVVSSLSSSIAGVSGVNTILPPYVGPAMFSVETSGANGQAWLEVETPLGSGTWRRFAHLSSGAQAMVEIPPRRVRLLRFNFDAGAATVIAHVIAPYG